jgi:hypothetical protein
MTPEQKIKYTIMVRAGCDMEAVTKENVDDVYEDATSDNCDVYDAANEFREGEITTDVECDWSRHYEARSVAAQMHDGKWVGWTYWYGGGKHGNPEEIDWMDSAYDLSVTEQERTVVVRTFSKTTGEKNETI